MKTIVNQNKVTDHFLSEEMRHIVYGKPGMVVRRGGWIQFGIVIFLFAMSWLIRYPDTRQETGVVLDKEGSSLIIQTSTSKKRVRLVVNDPFRIKAGGIVIVKYKSEKKSLLERLVGEKL